VTIDSVASLRAHLQTAVEIEHATLPPYLCALYSLEEGSNAEAVAVIESVVLEEMLHLTLAANLLNAVGGAPVLDSPTLLPAYPTFLPHSDQTVELSLRPFSPKALAGFMAIERPGRRGSLPEDDTFETIGQFYAAIEAALARLTVQLADAPGSLRAHLGTPLGTQLNEAKPALQLSNAQSFIAQLQNVAAAIRGTEALFIPGEEGIRSLRFIETCYRNRTLLEQPWLTAAETARARALTAQP